MYQYLLGKVSTGTSGRTHWTQTYQYLLGKVSTANRTFLLRAKKRINIY